jgi:integrase
METRNKIAFSFYIKRTRPSKTGEVPIYVKILVDGEIEEIAVLRSIHPDKWSKTKNGAAGNSKEARDLNEYLMHVRNSLYEHVKIVREKNRDVTARSIKNSYLGIEEDNKKVLELFEEHNKAARLLLENGKDFAPATVQKYETCKKHLQAYIKEKYKVSDMSINKVTPDFVKGFELYLKTVCNCGHNSSIKYIRNFKKITNNAFLNGWLKKDPFASIKLRIKKVDKGFLSDEELSLIMNKKFGNERLDNTKDVFLFGCFTGLAYSDLKSLTPEHIVKGEDGRMWIHTQRLKTDMTSHIPLLPMALQIIEKYQYNPHCQKYDKLLPVYTNQKMNCYLKEIADLCGITKKISTHMARHTFATTVTLNNDIPIESVSKMLGHSSIKMTETYARLLDKKVSKDMEKIRDKFTEEKVKIEFTHSLN